MSHGQWLGLTPLMPGGSGYPVPADVCLCTPNPHTLAGVIRGYCTLFSQTVYRSLWKWSVCHVGIIFHFVSPLTHYVLKPHSFSLGVYFFPNKIREVATSLAVNSQQFYLRKVLVSLFFITPLWLRSGGDSSYLNIIKPFPTLYFYIVVIFQSTDIVLNL